MIVVDSEKGMLSIIMRCSSPTEEIEMLTRAIAAAFRWRGCASDSDCYNRDGENLAKLAELLESLNTVPTVEDIKNGFVERG